MITAATLHKQSLFSSSRKLDLLHRNLIELAKKYAWHLHAWAVFANHYHFIAKCDGETPRLREFLSHLHTLTATELNRLDKIEGRRVWHNFWDSRLTYERSYLARLNYVHQNPVKHGLVSIANQYRWCSAAWFERISSAAMIKTIYGFKTDKLNIADDY
jgi:putative transposase